MSDQSQFQIGAFVAPLTASTANSLVQDADPPLYYALGFYQAVLATYLGARFDAEVTKAGLSKYAGKITTMAVPFDPLPWLQQGHIEPPILALFPIDEQWTERTRGWYQRAATFKLQWILPPLTLAQYLALYPLLRAAAKVIGDRTDVGYDPAYQSGLEVFAAGGVTQLDLGLVRYGSLQGLSANMNFPTVEVELRIVERREQTPGLQFLNGVDGSIAVTDSAGANPFTLIAYQDGLP